jgi:hypothetical protein
MNKYLSILFQMLIITLILSFRQATGQNSFQVRLEGLNENDTATVILQKSSEIYFKQVAAGNAGKVNELTFDLADGKWAIVIDATGYTFPPATSFDVPGNSTALVKLTPLLNEDYYYVWQDDDSYVGYATQTYVSEPAKIVVLDMEVKVPHDYSSIQLRNKYGIILSDDIEAWTIEDSYRIYKMFANLPISTFGEGSKTDPSTGENIRGIIKLTKDEQFRDLTITYENGIKVGTISQAAFHYAEPQIVTVDGIKGKFYSKRLYHAVVNFMSDFANDEAFIDHIAMERFGVRFMRSDQETEVLMSEDASNFQEFFREEKIEILSMFEELPDGFHKQEGLKYLVRRINGQPNPIYPAAAAIAWTGLHTIEFMEVAFSGSSLSEIRRLILHEKTHFLWAYTFDDQLKNDWIELGGWFQDPTAGSGWSTYNTTEFVSPYAHANNPDEDMAESVAYYLEDPDKLMAVSVQKYEFIRDRVMHGTRYIAQIREDLTFTVYNLFPDYTFPGKVKKIEVTVSGTPDEDKVVTIRATLHSIDPEIDGAKWGYIRFASSIGTIHDLAYFGAENGTVDSVLVGSTTFSKYEKSGYWTMASFVISDQVGNLRHENTSTLGMKLYIENPLEDIMPPKWNNDLKLELVEGKFSGLFDVHPDENGEYMQAIKVSYSFYDDQPLARSLSRMIIANADRKDYEVYSHDIQSNQPFNEEHVLANEHFSNKYYEMYLGVREHFQSGYYSITFSAAEDIGGNGSQVFFLKDTSDFNINPINKYNLFKDIRDSIYVETQYPDYLKPEIDANYIFVDAEPTNPIAPNGETKVNVTMMARDLSDFPGHESGVFSISFVLRDPLGIEHEYHNQVYDPYSQNSDSINVDQGWKTFNLFCLLPMGSPPGVWGISAASIMDMAGNTRKYSFIEYVRFDVIESEIVLEEPLDASINAKYINLANVDNIDISISCKPSAGLKFVYTIYSLMGGNVVRGEGLMTNDSLIIQGVNTQGVLDGVIKLTVQLVDSASQIIATKTVEYDKDTQRPKAYYTQTNLQNEGTSNLDDVIFEIVFDPEDMGGTYAMSIEPVTTVLKSTAFMGVVMTGTLENMYPVTLSADLTPYVNQVIKTTVTLTDTVLNMGDPVENYYLVLEDRVVNVTAETDYDSDGILDMVDPCPATSGSNNGCPSDSEMSINLYLNLSQGWNLFSASVSPADPDLKTVFSPLINDNVLVKVQNEAGTSLENYGIFGGWTNNIGDISPTKGYKVMVSDDCLITLRGVPVSYPYEISLATGWNIMGFPHDIEIDGKSIIQELIDRGTLVKVQDEKGNSIENWGVFGGWTNNIGNFIPGKGYKILLSAADQISIAEIYPKSATANPPAIAALAHYRTVYPGNGVDHMNINIVGLSDSFLKPGDEIAVFDGEQCVGAVKLLPVHIMEGRVSVPVSANDDFGNPGFLEGNPYQVKLWSMETGKEMATDPDKISGPEGFLKNESVFLSLEKYGIHGQNENDALENMVLVYPNPTSGTITISLANLPSEPTGVKIMNASGQTIWYQILEGKEMIVDLSGNPPGMYIVNVIQSTFTKTEKILLK